MAGQDLFAFSRSFDFHQRGDSNFRWAATSFPIIPARVSAEEPHECWVARATLEALNASAVGPFTSRSEGLNASDLPSPFQFRDSSYGFDTFANCMSQTSTKCSEYKNDSKNLILY